MGTDPSNRFARDLENFYPLSARDATFDRARENSSWNVNLEKLFPLYSLRVITCFSRYFFEEEFGVESGGKIPFTIVVLKNKTRRMVVFRSSEFPRYANWRIDDREKGCAQTHPFLRH